MAVDGPSGLFPHPRAAIDSNYLAGLITAGHGRCEVQHSVSHVLRISEPPEWNLLCHTLQLRSEDLSIQRAEVAIGTDRTEVGRRCRSPGRLH